MGLGAPNDYVTQSKQLTPDWRGYGRLKILIINELRLEPRGKAHKTFTDRELCKPISLAYKAIS